MDAPKRAHSVSIEAGGDTLTDLLAELQMILHKIRQGQTSCYSGGHSAGSYFKLTEDRSMTNKRYFEENEKYLEACRANDSDQGTSLNET